MYGPAVRCDDDARRGVRCGTRCRKEGSGAEDGETVEIVKGVSTQPGVLDRNVYAAKGQNLIVTKKMLPTRSTTFLIFGLLD
jgi:hypothetical protein